MKKIRIISAIFALCVIFAIVPCPGVAAAGMSGLEIVGQTAMTQQTFTDLSIIGANSSGLIDAINGTKNPAQTIGEWIKGEWDNWLLRQQLTWGTVLNIAASGARYTSNGNLLFNSQLSDLFTRFYNWLWDGEGGPHIIDNAERVESSTGSVESAPADAQYLYHPTWQYNITYSNFLEFKADGEVWQSIGAQYYVIIATNSSWNICGFSQEPFYLSVTVNNRPSGHGKNASQMHDKTGNYYYAAVNVNIGYALSNTTPGLSSVKNENGVLQNGYDSTVTKDVAYLLYHGYNIGDDQILGDPNKLGGLTGADTNVVAPPDVINWPDFGGGNTGYVDVNDYIGGLRGAIESQDGTADVNISDTEGVESTQTMELDQTTDIPVETETTSEMVNQGEVISTATPSTELADYTIDLRNYFPFCIPWDLYDMVTLLVADPVAPRVQYPFVIEPLNVNYTIDLDFSEFDSVAAVLRTMELLAAGIGLALMTKRLIQGGD